MVSIAKIPNIGFASSAPGAPSAYAKATGDKPERSHPAAIALARRSLGEAGATV